MLDLQSADDLHLMLHDLGKNKKKADNSWILQAAIDQYMTAPACVANEFTKLQLSTHIVDKFWSYTWDSPQYLRPYSYFARKWNACPNQYRPYVT